MKIKIVIPALQVGKSLYIGGYIAMIRRQKQTTQAKHERWKRHCFEYLDAALMAEGWDGMPVSSEGYKVTTACYFENRRHFDPLNVQKGIEDILVWRKGKSSKGTFYFKEDKNLAGEYMAPQYDRQNPRIEVTIERIES